MARARFEVYPDAGGGWRWRLRAANGRIIADSAEAYTDQHGAQRAATTVASTVADLVTLGATAVVIS